MKKGLLSALILGLVGFVFLFFSLPISGTICLFLALVRFLNVFRLGRFVSWLHAMAFETFSLLSVFCLRPFAWIWKKKVGKPNGRPILLIHGYLHDSGAWIYHKRELVKAGFGPIYVLNFKNPFLSITRYVEKVEEMARKIREETDREDLILIGHSMGGIVASLYATKVAKAGTVTDVITIGSPLHGTYMAKAGFGKDAKEMRKGSELLKETLTRIEKEGQIRFYFIASKTDQVVIPYSSALMGLNQKREFVLNDIGHVTLLYSPRVSKKIIEWLS